VNLTGEYRFRRSLFGRVVLEVRECWHGERLDNWTCHLEPWTKYRWRNATAIDLLSPKLRPLIDGALTDA